jgi:hypothetical protein
VASLSAKLEQAMKVGSFLNLTFRHSYYWIILYWLLFS